MKTILCYGDSNTWGAIPGTAACRFAPDVRWTGVLQARLGPDFRVAEAGLNGRTTMWDDPWEPWCNGLETLIPTMMMNSPLDLVVLMLGTNDLKTHSAWESAKSCRTLIRMIQGQPALFADGTPQVLLVSPPRIVHPLSATFAEPGARDVAAESEQFGVYYIQYAQEAGVPCFDAASVAAPAPAGAVIEGGGTGDGVHLTAAGHRALGEAIAAQVCALFPAF